jgi:hypothetical protein
LWAGKGVAARFEVISRPPVPAVSKVSHLLGKGPTSQWMGKVDGVELNLRMGVASRPDAADLQGASLKILLPNHAVSGLVLATVSDGEVDAGHLSLTTQSEDKPIAAGALRRLRSAAAGVGKGERPRLSEPSGH